MTPSAISTWPASLRTAPFLGAGQQIKHLADGLFPVSRLRQWEMGLDLVTIPPTVLLLDHIAGLGQVGDDAVRVTFGNGETCRDVAQSDLRVVGNAQEGPAVVGEEVPVSHGKKDSSYL